jgi:hypothetical protein
LSVGASAPPPVRDQGPGTSLPGPDASHTSPPRRPGPVPLASRRPLLQRPGPLPDRLRRQRPPRPAHQVRRRPAPRSPVHGRQPGPPDRPGPRRALPPAHGQLRQAPQLRALPHLHGPAHPHHRLLASRHPYQIRDTDGTPLTPEQGRAIVAQRYRVSDELRALRRTSHGKTGASRRHQESPGAPTPARPPATLRPDTAQLLDTA